MYYCHQITVEHIYTHYANSIIIIHNSHIPRLVGRLAHQLLGVTPIPRHFRQTTG